MCDYPFNGAEYVELRHPACAEQSAVLELWAHCGLASPTGLEQRVSRAKGVHNVAYNRPAQKCGMWREASRSDGLTRLLRAIISRDQSISFFAIEYDFIVYLPDDQTQHNETKCSKDFCPSHARKVRTTRRPGVGRVWEKYLGILLSAEVALVICCSAHDESMHAIYLFRQHIVGAPSLLLIRNKMMCRLFGVLWPPKFWVVNTRVTIISDSLVLNVCEDWVGSSSCLSENPAHLLSKHDP